MNAKKNASPRSSKSDRAYEELPELDDAMISRGQLRKGGRPISTNPRQLITIRLPADVIARWRATGPGWQTRMADRLSDAVGLTRAHFKPAQFRK
jgi:uncharacterized protein (DUF4415 family)